MRGIVTTLAQNDYIERRGNTPRWIALRCQMKHVVTHRSSRPQLCSRSCANEFGDGSFSLRSAKWPLSVVRCFSPLGYIASPE